MTHARVPVESLEAFCMALMRTAGIPEEDARLTTEVLVTTDTWGTHTHGTRQLRLLLKNVRAGRLSAEAKDEVVAEGPAWAMIDGHYAMPPAVAYRAMERAIGKARDSGIGYAGVRHSSHYGAAGFYAVLAARQGMIGLSMCNVDPCMTAPGSRGRVIGTNPIAYAAPAGSEPPVFLDIATSAVAATKIFMAKAAGKPIPDTWMVDDQGRPTTDPGRFPEEGAQLPMAGHKGYGLAVLVEVLSAVLTGAAVLSEVKSWVLDLKDPTNEGHAFIALNVGAMMPPARFGERMERMNREIRGAPRVAGTDRVYLPGEMEWERRNDALARGIALPEDVRNNLRAAAADAGIEAPGWL